MFRLTPRNTDPTTGSGLLPPRIAGTFETITDLLRALYIEGAEYAYDVATVDVLEFFERGGVEADINECDGGHVCDALVIEVMVDGEWRELLGLTHRTVQTVVTESRIL